MLRVGSHHESSGTRVARFLLTFVVVLFLAGALATTAGAQATVTEPDMATPTVTDPVPDGGPTPAPDPAATTPVPTEQAPSNDAAGAAAPTPPEPPPPAVDPAPTPAGETPPVDNRSIEAAWAKIRRVAFLIVKRSSD